MYFSSSPVKARNRLPFFSIQSNKQRPRQMIPPPGQDLEYQSNDAATVAEETRWYIAPSNCRSSERRYAADDANDASIVSIYLSITVLFLVPLETKVNHPQTEAWVPKAFFVPHTPLLLPHAKPPSFAPAGGLEAAEVDRSLLPLPPAD